MGAFFDHPKRAARERERKRRLARVEAWLRDEDLEAAEEIRHLAARTRAAHSPFHWMLEFPEIFHTQRPDPLADGQPGVAWMDAFVGNPPFAGKNGISNTSGPHYIDWLKAIHPGAHGNADLSAHFFRRADTLLGPHGTSGLIATNTIDQGDTRTTGLGWLLAPQRPTPRVLYDAQPHLRWPGEAAVTVSVIHLAKGHPAQHTGPHRLADHPAPAINSRLRPKPERAEARKLTANAGKAYVGSYVLGMGFVLTPEARAELTHRDPRNAQRIHPYLGGKEINTSPTQTFHRYVINFGLLSLEAAAQWPDLLHIVREQVKPERDRLKDNPDGRRRKAFWWHFGRNTPALYAALQPLTRCLVTARVTKHLMLSWQPTDRIFNEKQPTSSPYRPRPGSPSSSPASTRPGPGSSPPHSKPDSTTPPPTASPPSPSPPTSAKTPPSTPPASPSTAPAPPT